jgi:hypothetical protein
MDSVVLESAMAVRTHPWLHNICLASVPGPMTPLQEETADGLLRCFRRHGHEIQSILFRMPRTFWEQHRKGGLTKRLKQDKMWPVPGRGIPQRA